MNSKYNINDIDVWCMHDKMNFYCNYFIQDVYHIDNLFAVAMAIEVIFIKIHDMYKTFDVEKLILS